MVYLKGIPPSQNQMTTFQANNARMVTINRWVIEAINGVHFQNFKALKSIRNTQLPHIMDDFKIASALFNCFFSPRVIDKEVFIFKNKR